MTKEDAINAVHNAHHPDDMPGCMKWDVNRKWAEKAVNGYVALGLLKLSEPKTPIDKLCDQLGWGELNKKSLRDMLAVANLELVERRL